MGISQATNAHATAVSGGPAVGGFIAGIPLSFVTGLVLTALVTADTSGFRPWDSIPPDTNVAHKSATRAQRYSSAETWAFCAVSVSCW